MDPPQLNNYNKKNPGTSHAPKETIATNVKGTVKWFHRARGFGFITRDDTSEDVFAHYTSLKPMSINLARTKKRLNLMDKEKVQFDVVKTNDGLEAVNVVGKNGYLILDIIAYKRDILPFDLEIINDARVTGKVKWFNVKIKYGFIHCDYNNEDVFVHASAIIKNNPNKYKPSLCEGEPVEFDILKRADGKLEAVNVSGPQGLNVQGSRYSPDKSSSIEDTSNKNYTEQAVIGKVKWFNVKAGFGFINRNDNGQDVYAHYSAIINKNPNHRVRSLAEGEIVQFNITEGSKGAEAADITGVNGLPVQGSEYARPKNSPSKSLPPNRKSMRKPLMSGSYNGAQVGQTNNYRNNTNNRRTNGPRKTNMNTNRRINVNTNNSVSNGLIPNQYTNGIPPHSSGPTGGRSQNHSNTNYMPNNQYNDQNNYGGFRTKPRSYNPGFDDHRNQNQFHQQSAPAQNYHQQNLRNQQYSYENRFENQNENNHYLPMPPRNEHQGFVDQIPIQNGYFNNRGQPNQNNLQQNPMGSVAGVVIADRVRGMVKWYNFKNGFGFVTRADNNQDIFVHRSGLASNYGMQGLDDGELVEFDILQEANRLLAINVTGPSGSSLKGSKYASTIANPAVPTKVYRRRRGAKN